MTDPTKGQVGEQLPAVFSNCVFVSASGDGGVRIVFAEEVNGNPAHPRCAVAMTMDRARALYTMLQATDEEHNDKLRLAAQQQRENQR